MPAYDNIAMSHFSTVRGLIPDSLEDNNLLASCIFKRGIQSVIHHPENTTPFYFRSIEKPEFYACSDEASIFNPLL